MSLTPLPKGGANASLNQLPYLDSKHDFVWAGRQAVEAADSDVPVLRADKAHTVRSLTGKLLELVRLGMTDSGFPILVKETVDADGRTYSGLRIVGFLGMHELEHALCKSPAIVQKCSAHLSCSCRRARRNDQPEAG